MSGAEPLHDLEGPGAGLVSGGFRGTPITNGSGGVGRATTTD